MRHQYPYPATGCVRGGRAVASDHHTLEEVLPEGGEIPLDNYRLKE
jgi:hypothetical protein